MVFVPQGLFILLVFIDLNIHKTGLLWSVNPSFIPIGWGIGTSVFSMKRNLFYGR